METALRGRIGQMEEAEGLQNSWRRLAFWMLNAVIVVAGASVAFGRMPWDAQRTIWAEDGGIFLNDALNGSGWAGIFSPYEGYLHIVPRLGANLVASFVPVQGYGIAMNYASCLVVSLVALCVFYLSKSVVGNTLIRVCLASLVIFVAPGPLETLANFANVHWYLLWLTPWLLMAQAQSRAGRFGLFALSLLVSLTEILSLLFVPLFLYDLRNRSKWFARTGLLLGLLSQVLTTLSFPRSPSSGYPVNLLSVLEGWFLNSSSALMFGNSVTIAGLIQAYGPLPIVCAAIPFLVVFIFIMWKGNSVHRLVAAVMVLASFGTWAATQVVNPQSFFDYSTFTNADWDRFFLSRYSTAPSTFLLALLPLAAAVLAPLSRAAAAAILGGFLVLQLVFFFPTVVARTGGPVWSDGVNAGRAACQQDPGLAEAGVQIAPKGWFADKVYVRCDKLRDE